MSETEWQGIAPAQLMEEFAAIVKGGAARLPIDRDDLGREVRTAWVKWAQTQPAPKPSWLVPYDELSEADKEADRLIGEYIALGVIKWFVVRDPSVDHRTRLAPYIPYDLPTPSPQ